MNVTPIGSGLAALSSTEIALFASFLIVPLIVCILMAFKIKHDFKVPIVLSSAVIMVTGIVCIAGVTAQQNIDAKVNAVKDYVHAQGFDIKDGTIAVAPGTDAEFTVTKSGEDYTCTSYAPSSTEEKIFLVCDSGIGFGKGTLEDLAIQISGAEKRKDTAIGIPGASLTDAVTESK